MIRELFSLAGCEAFLEAHRDDPDPICSTPGEREERLVRAASEPDKRLLGAFRGGELTGLFVYLVLEDERYMEQLVELTREEAACAEALAWLEARYPGYQADFVFHPGRSPLGALLRRKGAAFFPEQRRMRFAGPLPAGDGAGVEPLGEATLAGYLALHDDEDHYWTGEKVAAAPDKFKVFVAVEDSAVVGYIDVTGNLEENEPIDLLVAPDRRRRGWGRKLLSRALRENGDRGMILQVDTDNVPALALYESLGFVELPGQRIQTATLILPAPQDGQTAAG